MNKSTNQSAVSRSPKRKQDGSIQNSPVEENPSPAWKKPCPPPIIVRHDSPVAGETSERMILRPRQKNPAPPDSEANSPIYIGNDPDENLPHEETLATAEAEPSPEDYEPERYTGNDPELIKSNIELREAWRLNLKTKYSKPLDALPPQPALYMGDDSQRRARSMLSRRIWRIQKQAWMKQQREKRLEKMLDKCSGKIEDLRIKPPGGLTQRELGLISPYLVKQSFELDDGPIPDEYVDFKAFLDQVRISPYNVKVSYQPSIYTSGFYCLDKDKFKEYPYMRKHLKEAIKLVIGAVKEERKQLYRALGGFNSFIQIKWHYLLSQDVKDATGTLQTVEAYLYFTPGTAPQTAGVEA